MCCTLAAQSRVGVIPSVLVVLEHVESSWLQRKGKKTKTQLTMTKLIPKIQPPPKKDQDTTQLGDFAQSWCALITDLGIFDFEGAAARVDVRSIEGRFCPLSALDRIKREH